MSGSTGVATFLWSRPILRGGRGHLLSAASFLLLRRALDQPELLPGCHGRDWATPMTGVQGEGGGPGSSWCAARRGDRLRYVPNARCAGLADTTLNVLKAHVGARSWHARFASPLLAHQSLLPTRIGICA